jgi:small conductance mechanosensitive channel
MSEELQQAQEIYQLIVSYLVAYGFQLLGAVVVLMIGIFVAGKVADMLNTFLLGKNIDVTLSKFTASTLKAILIIMVAIIALGQIDISITPLVAAIGALGLGAGCRPRSAFQLRCRHQHYCCQTFCGQRHHPG